MLPHDILSYRPHWPQLGRRQRPWSHGRHVGASSRVQEPGDTRGLPFGEEPRDTRALSRPRARPVTPRARPVTNCVPKQGASSHVASHVEEKHSTGMCCASPISDPNRAPWTLGPNPKSPTLSPRPNNQCVARSKGREREVKCQGEEPG